MRILIFSHGHPDLSAGGTEAASYALFQHLRLQGGIEVMFVAAGLETIANSSRRRLFYQGRADEMLVSLPRLDPLSLCSMDARLVVETLQPIIQQFRPDVIHAHHYLGIGLQALPWLKAQAKALVLTLHEYLALCHNHGQMVTADRNALCFRASPVDCARCFPKIGSAAFFSRERVVSTYLASVDRLICPSQFLKSRYSETERWDRDRFVSIENVLATADDEIVLRRRHDENSKVRIGFFGRYTAYKGVDVLLDAICKLSPEDRDRLQVGFHGGGLDKQPLEFQSLVHSLAERVRGSIFEHGSYSNRQVRKLMAAYDWIVVPSTWWENSPVVIQEALAAGIPVICADEGGMAEKVIEGITGVHFSLGSAADLSAVLSDIVGGRIQKPVVDASRSHLVSESALFKHIDLYGELLKRRSFEL